MRLLLLSALVLIGCKDRVPPSLSGVIPCTGDGQCPVAAPMCDLQLRVCTGCGTREDACPLGTICDEAIQRCVPGSYPGCRQSFDCPLDRPACVQTDGSGFGRCHECVEASQCRQPAPPALPVVGCHGISRTCERLCLCHSECWSIGLPYCDFAQRPGGVVGGGLCGRDGGVPPPDAAGFTDCMDGGLP